MALVRHVHPVDNTVVAEGDVIKRKVIHGRGQDDEVALGSSRKDTQANL